MVMVAAVVNYGFGGSENPAIQQLRLAVYPIIYKSLYIPGGCLGFLVNYPKQNPCMYGIFTYT